MRSLLPIGHVRARLVAPVIVLGALVGCGGSAQERAATTEVEQQTSPPALADTADTALGAGQQEAEVLPGYQKLREPWTGDLDAIVDRGYLRALVVHSRTSYFLDGAQQRGITYEAMVEFERFLNEKVPGNRKVHVVFIPVRRDQLISAVADGTGDLAAANLTVTPARQKLVDFSDAAVRNVKEVVVTGPTGPTLSSLDDLSDQEVHVRRSSSYYESLLSLNETFRAAGRAPVKIRLADENLEDEDLLEMLNAELLPAVIIDDHKAKLWAQVFDQITIHHTIAVREGGTVAWALRKNSPRLLGLVNDFAKDHRAGTLFGNILLNRYFRSTKWVTNPGSKEQMARFRATVDLFKQYAGRYEFDWLLVMAQAYQESTLDQRMQSHVGAVGVMQLLPSTAAGSPINIPNVHKLEDNIHAGTKYLRYITDQYFSDPEINAVNKTLFAFASYNGGPNRIARLRRKAKEQGFDSNIWFKNVEVVAAREIGQENVQYVSNIYKYYIAYKLITEEQESSADGA